MRILSAVALLNFSVAALMGLLLRAAPLADMPWMDYRHMTHAHSHVAMMGWMFMGLYALILRMQSGEAREVPRVHRWLFAVMQLAVVGMMFSFPVQGYGPVSIAFATLHMLCGYAVAVLLWRDATAVGTQAALLLSTSLALMAVSTFGVYALGPIAASGGRFSDVYNLCIQFFLHFQFNGWFTLAVAALAVDRLAKSGPRIGIGLFRLLYGLLLGSAMLLFALPLRTVWADGSLLFVNGMGALAQLGVAAIALVLLRGRKVSGPSGWLFAAAFVSLVLKAVAQTVLAFPAMADMPLHIRPLVVGFVHLTVLGMVSCTVLGLMMRSGDSAEKGILPVISVGLFIGGLILSELLLAVQGAGMWTGTAIDIPFVHGLFASAALLAAGILMMTFAAFKDFRQRIHIG